MKATLASLKKIVLAELGRPPSRSTYEELINDAGEHWSIAHSWRYLRDRTPLEIQITAGVEDYVLGLGVRALSDIVNRPDTTFGPLRIVDPSYFVQERERYLSGLDRLYQPLATTRYQAVEGEDRLRLVLSIYPAQLNERIVVEYIAGWIPLDNENDILDMPPDLVIGFKEWLRRYAMGREKQPTYNVDQAWASFYGGPMGYNARAADGSSAGRMVPTISNTKRAWMNGRRGFRYGNRHDYDWGRFAYLRLR